MALLESSLSGSPSSGAENSIKAAMDAHAERLKDPSFFSGDSSQWEQKIQNSLDQMYADIAKSVIDEFTTNGEVLGVQTVVGSGITVSVDPNTGIGATTGTGSGSQNNSGNIQ